MAQLNWLEFALRRPWLWAGPGWLGCACPCAVPATPASVGACPGLRSAAQRGLAPSGRRCHTCRRVSGLVTADAGLSVARCDALRYAGFCCEVVTQRRLVSRNGEAEVTWVE